MSPRPRIEPEASAEIDEAGTYYDLRRAGLALTFLHAVDAAVNRIGDWPGMGAFVREIEGGAVLRQIRVEGFPYHVGYMVTDEEPHVRVLAVAHEKRRPGYWTRRR